jgi:hypothetical protein
MNIFFNLLILRNRILQKISKMLKDLLFEAKTFHLKNLNKQNINISPMSSQTPYQPLPNVLVAISEAPMLPDVKTEIEYL